MEKRAMSNQPNEEFKRWPRRENDIQSQFQQDAQAQDRMAGESPATFTGANEQQSQRTPSPSRIRKTPAISANYINQGWIPKISEEARYKSQRIALLAIGLPIVAMTFAAYFAWRHPFRCVRPLQELDRF